ncbi:amidohydrolase family protein [Pseudidiomarina sp. CB1]|uniref:amidohydrolase family protein n=1 Tax=Pseudidiomarina sp. CB1 TaxID=2972484 RepID=UPI0021630DDD|nr:amidohydrolase family protein [Pseudidiomarina sp. CB1]
MAKQSLFTPNQLLTLHLLRHAGVTLLSGSDLFMGSVVDELLYLQKADFTPEELLIMSTFTTPKVLFPQRNIGRLDEGYEASFVSFDRNPMNDLEYLRSPAYVVKQGRQLQTP